MMKKIIYILGLLFLSSHFVYSQAGVVKQDSIIIIDGVELYYKENDSIEYSIGESGFVCPKENYKTFMVAKTIEGVFISYCQGGYRHNVGQTIGVIEIILNDSLGVSVLIDPRKLDFELSSVVSGDVIKLKVRPYIFDDELLQKTSGIFCRFQKNVFFAILD
ncbi:hypothetical protein [Crocinitomix catalasitica]|uniref:hypothetical protein n=1 Tax=Crocinitomix catalasitica TaxID=184607 RepID=UPI00048757BA|nr:hypothetical protein [Crocinitomix catalasitica]